MSSNKLEDVHTKVLDFIVRMIYIMCTDTKGGATMSPARGRPPIENPKNVRFEVRLTQEQAKKLAYCAKKLEVSRTDVINKGIELVQAQIDKK